MHTALIVSWRNILALVLLLPFIWHTGIQSLKTVRLKGHLWRAAIGMAGMQLWTYSISVINLNVATALSFTAPLFASLFAVLFLKEHSDRYRWAALITGFLGTIIIVEPGMEDFSSTSLIVLLTTSLWATAGLMVKSLTKTEPPFRIVVLMTCFMTLFSLPISFGLGVFRLPTFLEFEFTLAIAITSLTAHFLQVKAYSMATVVSLMPLDFTRLIFTGIFAYLFFAETLGGNTLIGSMVVLISAFAIASRDAKLRVPASIPRA